MDFRRIPFQFSTTDPVKRQEELRRRFGLPADRDKMHVDFACPSGMGGKAESSRSASSSPRLQHRVPIFVEGSSEPLMPTSESQNNVDTGRKPHVRVIPIEIEGSSNNSTKRHRTFSGSIDPPKTHVEQVPEEYTKHPAPEVFVGSPKAPRICNIPIKIEGDSGVKPKVPVNDKVKIEMPKVKVNGCSASKVAKISEKSPEKVVPKKKESPEQVALKKIESILEKLKGYQADVEKFSGNNKEKQYRYLDEMLTRCMLELDGIDTMGLETIRLKRKEVIRKVQANIDLLESKVIREPIDPASGEPMEVESSNNQDSEDAVMKESSEEAKVCEESVNSDYGDEVPEMEIESKPSQDSKMTQEMSEVTEPHQISEMDTAIENMTIMETDEANLKSDTIEPSTDSISKDESRVKSPPNAENMNVETNDPIQITDMEAENFPTTETEPVIEEPLSDSREENTIEVDLNSCNEIESDLDSSTIKISEVEEGTISETGATEKDMQPNEQLQPIIETISNIPNPADIEGNQETKGDTAQLPSDSQTKLSDETDASVASIVLETTASDACGTKETILDQFSEHSSITESDCCNRKEATI